MRLFQAPASLLSTVALVLAASEIVLANPVYKYVNHNVILAERQCASYCGADGQYCCQANEQCITYANNVATCLAGAQATAAAGGQWMTYTTTWVETNLVTRTSVYSTFVGATSQASPTAQCAIACGPSKCCGWGETCADPSTGQCIAGGGLTTATAPPTTTVPFESAVPTGTNIAIGDGEDGGGGLSGGAIAGIVIGVLAGILLLILLCLFCCARTIFNSVLALFGIGKKKHVREETYIESHHSHSGVGGGRRWYGNQGPARPPKEQKSGWAKAGGTAAILGGLALALGLKRKNDRRHEEKSDYTSSYTYSDYTSSSSASSSDRRTRDTRRSSRR